MSDPALPVTIERMDPRPLPVQIADQVRQWASSGTLAGAVRLPSTRRLAADLGISRGVAEQAWDQLRAEGWLTTRVGSGTWLEPRRLAVGRSAPRRGAEPTRPVVMMDAGTPWRDPRHAARWRRAWREVSASEPPRGYGDPRGLLELREALAERLARTRGLVVAPEELRLTSGTTDGLRHLLAGLPDGPVGLEDPGYRAAVFTVEASGRRATSLPATGPITDLTGLVAAYVTPAHQHPLGRVMPAADRVALVAAARSADAIVIEDDYDSEFRYDVAPVPALASAAPELVAYLGTAAKSVLPSLRLGWMVVPDALRGRVDRFREITHDTPSWPVQRALLTLLRDGYVDAMVRSARRVYGARSAKVVAALSPYAELAGPVAGMYATWLLDQDAAVRAQEAALAAGFRINLLSDYCRAGGLAGLVVGFGGPSDDELDRALEVIAGALEAG